MKQKVFEEKVFVPVLERRIRELEAELAEAKAFAERLSDELDKANKELSDWRQRFREQHTIEVGYQHEPVGYPRPGSGVRRDAI